MHDDEQQRILESLRFYADSFARLPTLDLVELCETIANVASSVLRHRVALVALAPQVDSSASVHGHRGLDDSAVEALADTRPLIDFLWREAKEPTLFHVASLQPTCSKIAEQLGLGPSLLVAPVRVVTDYQDRQAALLIAARPREGRQQISANAALTTIDVLAGLAAGGIASYFVREELKRAEVQKIAAETASEVRSQFLANMSHEIRTPLNAVLGMTELLLRTDLSDRQARYTNMVQNAGTSLLSVINDILDFSKIDAGKLHLHLSDFSLHDEVEEVATMLARIGQEKGLEVVCMLHPNVPNTVHGDRSRVRQILTNLTANAVKFTAEGEVVLRVLPTESNTCVRFEVSDTGIGMEPEEVDEIFEPFSQADSSDSRMYEGTGLGLAISTQLVELMGGKIGVNSTRGQGSTFWFTAQFASPHGKAAARLTPSRSMLGLRVLVVDDNATNRYIVSEYVRNWRMECDAVEGGTAAMAQLRSAAAQDAPYELIVLDMQMPEMTGLELAHEIRASASLADIPIILLSSIDTLEPSSLADAGIHMYLTKPVRQSELFDCVADAIGSADSFSSGKPLRREPPTQEFSRPSPSGSGCHCPRVLVAEDNHVNQEMIVGMLGELGIEAHVVSDGQQALDVLANACYSAILMDCKMPVLDGYDATAKIRKREADTQARTPVIGLSAHALAGDEVRAIEAGMDAYLTKPVTLDRLEDVLLQVMVTPGPSKRVEADDKAVAAIDFSRATTARTAATFLRYVPGQVEALRKPPAGDIDGLIAAAHRLRGSCLDIGAATMADLCQQLESAAATATQEAQLALIADIEAALVGVQEALRARFPE